MIYMSQDIHLLKPEQEVWAFDYKKVLERGKSKITRNIKPTFGRIGTSRFIFEEYSDTNKEIKSSVDIWCRCYADTYEEAVEVYNSFVKEQINKLKNMIKSMEADFIEEDKESVKCQRS